MTKIPYFPFYVSDWLGSRKVLLMTDAQRGIYITLLAHQWSDLSGSIPTDRQILQRMLPGSKWSNIDYVMKECFVIEGTQGERARNERLNVEQTRALVKSQKAKESAKYLWNKKKQDANAERTQSERYANQNQNHSHKKIESKDISVRKKRETDPRIKEAIDYFHTQCQSVLGFAPAINGGQDGKRVQAALRVMPLPDVKKCIDFFLPSKKSKELGCTLSIALSAHSINLYKQGGINGTRYDQLKAYFGIPERAGADGISRRGNSAFGSNNKPQVRPDASAILDGEAEEIFKMESE